MVTTYFLVPFVPLLIGNDWNSKLNYEIQKW
jgi:hypothetical protein